MSKLDTPIHVTVGERDFHIFPFPAFKCVNLTGEVGSVILPIMASVIPLIKSDSSVMDTDVSDLSGAFQNFSGDKLEKLLRKLVLENQNITVTQNNGKTVRVNEDMLNEFFCGEIDNLFILAFEVMRLNFAGFFERLMSRFGVQEGQVSGILEILKNMEVSTPVGSQN